MTVFIVPCVRETVWSEAYFPNVSMLHMPVAGKTWAEHLLDYCHGLGATAVRILDWTFDENLQKDHLGDGSRWGFRLDYTGARLFRSPEEVKHQNAAFIGTDSDVRVLWGPVFPYKGELVQLDSLRTWYDMNFTVLRDPADRILPGYSAEAGVFIGENVAIKTHAEVKGPVVLDDNVYVENFARIEGDVIVGRGAFIEVDCAIRHSVIFPHTYLGRHNVFENKIVRGSRIIDPETGSFVDVEEAGVTVRFKQHERIRGIDVWEWFHALLLVGLLGLPYLLLLPLNRVLKHHVWGYKLSYTRMPGILRALFGRGPLIRRGTKGKDAPFCASDVLTAHRTPSERRLDDMWYACNRTPRFISAIVFKGLFNRLVSPVYPDTQKELQA